MEGENEKLHARWQEMLHMKPKIRLRDIIHEPIPYYAELSKIESNVEILEDDLYRLIGIYVICGEDTFVNYKNILVKDLRMLVQKYCAANRSIGSPSRPIWEIVRHFPFYAAEHLHDDRGTTPYIFELFPRCLAFQEGCNMIPKTLEWEPLRMMWLMWYAFCKRLLVDDEDIKCPIPEISALSDDIRENLMNFFGLVPPPHFQVMRKMREIVDGSGSSPYDDMPYVMYRCYFGVHANDLYSYYKRILGLLTEEELAVLKDMKA